MGANHVPCKNISLIINGDFFIYFNIWTVHYFEHFVIGLGHTCKRFSCGKPDAFSESSVFTENLRAFSTFA